jgi:hypothetical protein
VRAATATLTSELKVSVQIDKPALSPPTWHVEDGVWKEREHEVDFHVTGEAASHYPGELTPKDGSTLYRRGKVTLIKFRNNKEVPKVVLIKLVPAVTVVWSKYCLKPLERGSWVRIPFGEK